MLSLRRFAATTLVLLVAVSATYLGYVGWQGSEQLLHHEKSTNCMTPAALGWRYEAINYDIADDTRIAAANPDPLHCAGQGEPAGDAVVARDGIHIAGWYLPSGRGDPPDAPTVILVHGLGANKSDMLRYAEMVHDEFNLVIPDLRGGAGRSTGDVTTIGALEYRDVTAILDWLEATKHPRAVGLLGDSGGAAAGARLARTDPRIRALVMDSVHARFAYPLEDALPRAERLTQLGVPALPFVWAVYAAMWVRTGSTPADADPLDALGDLGVRPIMLIYGTADSDDLPARNARVLFDAARAIGIPVEIYACEGAVHGRVVDVCPADYRDWVVPFFDRAFGTAAAP